MMSNPNITLIPVKDYKYLVNSYSCYLLDRSPDFALAYNDMLELYCIVRPMSDYIVSYCFRHELDENIKDLLE